MQGPLRIIKYIFFVPGLSGKSNVVDFISRTCEHLQSACAVAKEALLYIYIYIYIYIYKVIYVF